MATTLRAATQMATKKVAPKKVQPRKVAKKGGGFGSDVTPTKGWGLPGAGDEIDLSNWYGAGRKLYLPGGLLEPSDVPSYLTGEFPGDYGLDLFGLSESKADVEKYRAFELIHSRWAMLAMAGILLPEALASYGADIKGAVWFETGAVMLENGFTGTLNYFAAPWGIVENPLPLPVVTAIEVGLLYFVESYRGSGSGPEGYVPGKGSFTTADLEACSDPLHPGGPFDPFGLADDPVKFEELKVKEIKNGRLAMISFLGCIAQAAVTGEGPYANWAGHVAAPFQYNLLTILGAGERAPTL